MNRRVALVWGIAAVLVLVAALVPPVRSVLFLDAWSIDGWAPAGVSANSQRTAWRFGVGIPATPPAARLVAAQWALNLEVALILWCAAAATLGLWDWEPARRKRVFGLVGVGLAGAALLAATLTVVPCQEVQPLWSFPMYKPPDGPWRKYERPAPRWRWNVGAPIRLKAVWAAGRGGTGLGAWLPYERIRWDLVAAMQGVVLVFAGAGVALVLRRYRRRAAGEATAGAT